MSRFVQTHRCSQVRGTFEYHKRPSNSQNVEIWRPKIPNKNPTWTKCHRRNRAFFGQYRSNVCRGDNFRPRISSPIRRGGKLWTCVGVLESRSAWWRNRVLTKLFRCSRGPYSQIRYEAENKIAIQDVAILTHLR